MTGLKAEGALASYQVNRSCNNVAMQYMECDTHLQNLRTQSCYVCNENIGICFAYTYTDIQSDSSSVPPSKLLSWKPNKHSTAQSNLYRRTLPSPSYSGSLFSPSSPVYIQFSHSFSVYVEPSHRLLSIINHTAIISPPLTTLNHSCLTTRIAPSYPSASAFIPKVVLDLVVCADIIIPYQLDGLSISTVSVNS